MSNMNVLIFHPRGIALGIVFMTVSTKLMTNDAFIKLTLKALLHEPIGLIAREVLARDHSESHRRPSLFAHRRCGHPRSILHVASFLRWLMATYHFSGNSGSQSFCCSVSTDYNLVPKSVDPSFNVGRFW
jgi:hypothetical protein